MIFQNGVTFFIPRKAYLNIFQITWNIILFHFPHRHNINLEKKQINIEKNTFELSSRKISIAFDGQ